MVRSSYQSRPAGRRVNSRGINIGRPPRPGEKEKCRCDCRVCRGRVGGREKEER